MVLSTDLKAFLRRLYKNIAEVTWGALALFVLFHFVTSWLGFVLAGEGELREAVTYIYYYATTATTIGYGDLSPTTDAGRLWAVAWLYPGSIALFTSVIAKGVSDVSEFWRKKMNGLGDYSTLVGATVVIGHHPLRTRRMIDEMLAGGTRAESIVLVSKTCQTAPDDRALFVRAEDLTDRATLVRAGVAAASRVVVYADSDEDTLTAALAAAALASSAHIVCYFANESAAELLRSHCPKAECVVSTAVEQVVRAVQDPGSSSVIAALASTTDAATIYSVMVPRGTPSLALHRLAELLRRDHRANLIAFDPDGAGGAHPIFGYDDAARVEGGARLYVIAERRLDSGAIAWQAAAGE